MTIYHVNPETKRANICRATIRDCKYGSSSEHFESKVEAQQFIEKKLSEELSNFSTFTKKKSSPKITLEKALNLVSEAKMDALVKKRLRCAYTLKEIDKLLKEYGSYSKIPFEIVLNGNYTTTLDYEDPETIKTFTKGACAVLAYKLHEVTGYPIIIFTYRRNNAGYWAGHVALKLPDGQHFDVEGSHNEDWVNQEWRSGEWSSETVSLEKFRKEMGLKIDENPLDKYGELEKAVVSKICYSLIKDYNLGHKFLKSN